MEKIPSYDGMLILLPGSKTDPDAVRCLCEITGFDNYLVRVKLNTKLPLPLCRCMKEEIINDTGDYLSSAGICFYVMDHHLYEAPFQSKRMKRCRADLAEIIFCDHAKEEYHFPSGKEVLLLEGVYRTNTKNELLSKTMPEMQVKFDEKKRKQQILHDYETLRVIFLYKKGDPVPLILIDMDFDYGFLGHLKGLTSAANFKALKEKIETACSRRFNLDMAQHAFSLPLTAAGPILHQSLKKQKKKEKAVVPSSNEDAVNRMSRFMYGQWCVEMGWVQRILSADYSIQASKSDICL